MANYTLELRQLPSFDNEEIFNFDYLFYNEEERANFEKLFIDYYFFHEIGFETVCRFKKQLQTKLNLIYPVYKQLYELELKSKNINFLNNKDLIETFERDIQGTNDTLNTSTTDNTVTIDYKESNVENGNASLNLTNGSLTNVNNSKTDNKVNTSADTLNNSNQTEKTRLVSQGNIGVTSSAELLRGAREVIISLNMKIIEECKDLFMQVY